MTKPRYSELVPIPAGEYILNVLARGSATEMGEMMEFLAGSLAGSEAILRQWLVSQGHSFDDLPALIEARRIEMQWKTKDVKQRAHWLDEKD